MADRSAEVSRDQHPKGASRIWTDIDLEKDGKSFGYFRLNISAHEKALSWIPIPVAVIKNGAGPRVLLLGGVHGDEYEGQVMLMKLMRQLEPEDVRGQIIILSAANPLACFAGSRVSPVDQGNLNRLFPGDPNGSPTAQIAYFIDNDLIPKVDYVLDFHSGGSGHDFMPSAHVYYSADEELFGRSLHLLQVFGMPTSVVLDGLMGKDERLIGTCERYGVLRFSSELGGAGRVSPEALRQAEHGLARLLYDIGVVTRPLTTEPPRAIRLLTRLPNRQYIYAMASGLFEPYFGLGAEVSAGETAGAIHFPETPWREPEIVTFRDSGIIYAMRARARTELGDLLFIIAVPWSR